MSRPPHPRFRCINSKAYPFTHSPSLKPYSPLVEIPSPEDAPEGADAFKFSNIDAYIEKMGIGAAFFLMGQLRCHELSEEVNPDQLAAALGIAPTQANHFQFVQEVRGKILRMEQERRNEATFSRCLNDLEIHKIGTAVYAYANGFHTALGQLANTIALSYINAH